MPLGHEHWMRLALEEAARGGAEGNIAIGSCIVRDDAVVAYGRNREAATGDPTAHAEMVAVREGARAIGGPALVGLALYTTWEPCPMCLGAIMAGGLGVLVMGARMPAGPVRWSRYAVEPLIEVAGFRDRLTVVTGILPEECVRVRREWEARNATR
jgi:tRNA(adenine34) deaminase